MHTLRGIAKPCLQGWGQYNQTAPSSTAPVEQVTITNPIHPLLGQHLPIRRERRLGTHRIAILEHPDGGTISLPTTETSLESAFAEPPSSERKLRLFEPRHLLQLSQKLIHHGSAPKAESNLLSAPASADKQHHKEVALQEADALPS